MWEVALAVTVSRVLVAHDSAVMNVAGGARSRDRDLFT